MGGVAGAIYRGMGRESSVKEGGKPKENLKLVSDGSAIGGAVTNFKMYSVLGLSFGEITPNRDHENSAD
ncbi:hypothetical protein GCM10027185_59100 [Spirosoma pulveris]